jgi:translation initiation factor 2B subunit (eIF-2B alpha/beta/delta family)
MGGKRKGKSGAQEPVQSSATAPTKQPQQQPSQVPPISETPKQQQQPTSNETSDLTKQLFQKLDQITQQLKALSPKKKEDTTTTAAMKTVEKETVIPPPHSNMEEKSRDQIKEDRQRKKAEAAARKALKKAENPSPQQPSKSQQPKDCNKENPSVKPDLKVATENVPPQESKSALKQISPIELSKDKSNLKVRFDIQPGNTAAKPNDHKPRKSKFILATPTNVHPVFRRLSARCDANKLSGVNELLYEFHGTLIEFINGYNGEPDISYKASLKTTIQPQLNCLSDNSARPFPLAMGNLIRQFRKKLNGLDENLSVQETKEHLTEWIKEKRIENFELAGKAITEFTIQKLRSQSHRNILTYSRCPVVEQIILTAAAEENLDLHVFVVDSPIGHGKVLLDTFSEHNILCTYGELSSIGYLIDQVSLVLLGCSGILSNGRVVAPRGSSLLALCAQTKNIPVLVAAKTCTFVDKVRLDEHISTALLSEPIETIPEDLVTALVTDIRILPPSSAPAVLKAKQLANED